MQLRLITVRILIHKIEGGDQKIMVWDFLLLIPAFICSLYMKYRSKICTYDEFGQCMGWLDTNPIACMTNDPNRTTRLN